MLFKNNFLIYSRRIRYSLFFLTLIMMIASIRVYLNDFNIEKSIGEELTNEKDIIHNDNFDKNFYKPYLESQYAVLFMSHDNGLALPGESIVKFNEPKQFENQDPKIAEIKRKEEVINITKSNDAWDYFISKKIDKFITNF